ncbi:MULTISPECIES: peptidylprolyl isomerase [unclassified Micromonospora]|uniref:peptidylprolyl isomerase n=1 Tax=unclassified Micromonospora TaxID=2617518 RepID=UPI001B395687|nr:MULTISPECIES: peptidylprolyl isomerase [unclassified Micromonospora]MBQ1045333.1 peptidylprolyl isomerase [Micromonospora sp. C72]MBQ1058041.1 peptidylprolyl isomerase [Micromonospora sp. C32]
MASSRDRQRKLARAKLDRQLARRAAVAKRRRQIRAGVGAAVVLVLIVAGSAWALGAFDSEPEKQAAEDVCLWTAQDGAVNTNLKDVGEPPTTGLPTSGTRPMTITTNQGGPITVELDQTDAPCGSASLSYLAGRSFFDNTTCHEITAEGALRCGDPTGTGLGGPTYSFFDENVPSAPEPSPSASPAPGQPATYPKGTVAMIGNPPGSNASQFLIFFKDASPAKPAYSVVGKVTGGLDVVEKIGAMPTVDNGNGAKVKPQTQILVQSVTVGEPGAAPADSPAPSPSASAG